MIDGPDQFLPLKKQQKIKNYADGKNNQLLQKKSWAAVAVPVILLLSLGKTARNSRPNLADRHR